MTLFAQTGDTITCYNNKELKQIATRVVRANECDTLLILADSTIKNKDSQINNLLEQVSVLDSVNTLQISNIIDYKTIITDKDQLIQDQDKQIKKLHKKLKWTLTGCVTTGIISILVLIFSSVN